MVGSHEELYRAMETDRVDLVLNDQRRAFSDRYNNEILAVDVIGDPVWSDSTIDRIPLVRNGDPVRKTYCAFWRKDNSGYYIEDFSDILKEAFA